MSKALPPARSAALPAPAAPFAFAALALAAALAWIATGADGTAVRRAAAVAGAVAPAAMTGLALVAGRGVRWTGAPALLGALMASAATALAGTADAAAWIAATLLAITGLLLERSFPTAPPRGPDGPAAVGATIRRTSDIVLRIWYPAAPGRDARRSPYLTGWPRRILGMPTFLPSHLDGLPTAAWWGAPPADGAPAPVALYLHGALGFGEENAGLAMELASRGYLVAAVEARDPDAGHGLDAATLRDPAALAAAVAERILPGRLADARAALRALDGLASDDPLLGGRFDAARIGVIGFSLGGAVGTELSLVEPRVAAIVNLDGNGFDAARREGAAAPYLHLSQSALLDGARTGAAGAHTAAYLAEVGVVVRRTAARWPATWLRLEGSGHVSFTDIAAWTPVRPGALATMLGAAPAGALHATIRAATVAFLDEHLRSRPGAARHLPALPGLVPMDAGPTREGARRASWRSAAPAPARRHEGRR